eukprot:3030841-Rhodomonas_salina.1
MGLQTPVQKATRIVLGILLGSYYAMSGAHLAYAAHVALPVPYTMSGPEIALSVYRLAMRCPLKRGARVQGPGSRVQGPGLRDWGPRSRAEGLGLGLKLRSWVQGLGIR